MLQLNLLSRPSTIENFGNDRQKVSAGRYALPLEIKLRERETISVKRQKLESYDVAIARHSMSADLMPSK